MAQNKKSGKNRQSSTLPRFFTLEMLMFTFVVLSGFALLWSIAMPIKNIGIMVGAGIVFTFSLVVVIRLLMDPDNVRARQSDAMLKLASQTLACMKEGLNKSSAQKVCRLLLPSTAAIAVAITDKDQILGYAGSEEERNPTGSEVRTHATHATLEDGKMRILLTAEDIGFPTETSIKAAIIVPLAMGGHVEGTLKFYYRRPHHISETQKSIAEGFGKLLSTQMAAAALEQQTKLATSMELKALQSQINPHFLGNTLEVINWEARLAGDVKVSMMLEALSTILEATMDRSHRSTIRLSEELHYVNAYLTIIGHRLGRRLTVEREIDESLLEMQVPRLVMQPILENAVEHGVGNKQHGVIVIRARRENSEWMSLEVENDSPLTPDAEARIRALLTSEEQPAGIGATSLGIRNVHQRLRILYGEESGLSVKTTKNGSTLSSMRVRLPQA